MNSWYILRIFSHHLKLLGPLTLEMLKEGLSTGKLSFSDLVYYPQDRRRWVRAFEVAELLAGLPEEPSQKELEVFEAQINKKPQPPKGPDEGSDRTRVLPPLETPPGYEGNWYLQFEGIEFGPFVFLEAEKIVKSGKFSNGTLLIWHEKLMTWVKISAYQVLTDSLAIAIAEAGKMVIEKGVPNKRSSRREILPASITIVLRKLHEVGICWDISDGGLQAYRLDADLSVGSIYKLQVIPISVSEVPKFTVHAKLMWINEISERMGFQFVDDLEKQTVVMHLKRRKGSLY